MSKIVIHPFKVIYIKHYAGEGISISFSASYFFCQVLIILSAVISISETVSG